MVVNINEKPATLINVENSSKIVVEQSLNISIFALFSYFISSLNTLNHFH